MEVGFSLAVDFLESLLLVWTAAAFRHGQRLYALAAVGILLAIVGRLSRDVAAPYETLGLQLVGLAGAGLVLAYYLVTEEVEVEGPPGGSKASAPAAEPAETPE